MHSNLLRSVVPADGREIEPDLNTAQSTVPAVHRTTQLARHANHWSPIGPAVVRWGAMPSITAKREGQRFRVDRTSLVRSDCDFRNQRH
jgi:hypothetical protein